MENWEKQELIKERLNDFYYEKLKFCGCGNPGDTLKLIKELLNAINDKYVNEVPYEVHQNRIHSLFEFEDKSKPKLKFTDIQNGIIQFVMYQLDLIEVLEHGGSIGGSWLTSYGKQIMEYLNECEDIDTVLI
ncbi:hypothetical protein [uncultured Metabacillus sp.]|uniref:hypothetical protein n=1 Tax=Metabacillus sp. Hm71 TaxID=3450743 RepID=UPI00263674FE|nr:hypothetical protein [uncultured Metabacillus sp.]